MFQDGFSHGVLAGCRTILVFVPSLFKAHGYDLLISTFSSFMCQFVIDLVNCCVGRCYSSLPKVVPCLLVVMFHPRPWVFVVAAILNAFKSQNRFGVGAGF